MLFSNGPLHWTHECTKRSILRKSDRLGLYETLESNTEGRAQKVILKCIYYYFGQDFRLQYADNC